MEESGRLGGSGGRNEGSKGRKSKHINIHCTSVFVFNYRLTLCFIKPYQAHIQYHKSRFQLISLEGTRSSECLN